MGRPLYVLLVEDSDDDAFLILRELRNGGYDVEHGRVFTPETLRAALAKGGWDVILCDYHAPEIEFDQAVALCRQADPDVPLIAVSATAEAKMAETLAAGADDCVLKNNLTRLCPAIEAVMAKGEERRRQRRIAAADPGESRRRSVETADREKRREMAVGGKTNILIVDDRPDVLLSMQAILASLGENLVMASSGDEALRRLLERDFAVILLDVQMPGMDGFETAALVRQRERSKHIPIIFVTAIGSSETHISRGYALGAVDYLFKPLDADILRSKVAAFVQMFRANEQVKRASEERFRSVAETATDAIVVIDATGTIVLWNQGAERLYGYTAGEAIGMDFVQTLPERLRLLLRESVRRAISPESAMFNLRAEGTALSKDGREIPVDISFARWWSNKKLFFTAILRDITERKLNERRLSQSLELVRKTLSGVVKALSLTVEMRDPYTAGHQQRVAAIAMAVAREMALDQQQSRRLGLAASVHDLGKISVPAEILSKPGRLSEAEMSLMRYHPQAGSDILRPVEFPWPVADIILQHHERLDGSGYPRSLKGEDILLEARIIGVADVIEAMSSHRPYRPALGVELAMEEVRNHRGSRYDPMVVDACLRILEQKGLHVEDYEIFGDLRLVPFSVGSSGRALGEG